MGTRPLVRNAANTALIDVFCKGGWKMKMPDGDYITMTAANTKFRNANNTAWINFVCPLPPPTSMTGGNLRANRIVDDSGYLWCAGNAIGVYENGTVTSPTWGKVKYSATGEYIKGIKRIEAGGGRSTSTPPTTLFMEDGRILFSGDPSYGSRGNGTGNNLGNLDSTVIDVTAAWNASLASVASDSIAHFDVRGALIRDDGIPFVLGLAETAHNDGSPDTYRGYLPAAPDSSVHVGNNNYIKWLSRWKRPNYTPDGNTLEPLPQLRSIAKGTDEMTFAITADGRLLQPSYFERLVAPSIPTPVRTTYALRELHTPFTDGTPHRLHMGGILETTSGDLFYPERKEVQPYLEYMQEFLWKPLYINVNAYGSAVKKIMGHVQKATSTTWSATAFVLLEDGRLLATGENLFGWFGNPAVTKTLVSEVIILQEGVMSFDLNGRSCIVMKEGGALFATGANPFNHLGLGVGAPSQVSVWSPCVFT